MLRCRFVRKTLVLLHLLVNNTCFHSEADFDVVCIHMNTIYIHCKSCTAARTAQQTQFMAVNAIALIILFRYKSPQLNGKQVKQVKLNSNQRVSVFSHLPIDVFLQTDGAVRGGAAAQWIRGSTAALTLALSLGLELSCLHLFQGLDGHSVHGALWWGGGRWERVSGIFDESLFAFKQTLLNLCRFDAKQEVDDCVYVSVGSYLLWTMFVFGDVNVRGCCRDFRLLPLKRSVLQCLLDAFATPSLAPSVFISDLLCVLSQNCTILDFLRACGNPRLQETSKLWHEIHSRCRLTNIKRELKNLYFQF